MLRFFRLCEEFLRHSYFCVGSFVCLAVGYVQRKVWLVGDSGSPLFSFCGLWGAWWRNCAQLGCCSLVDHFWTLDSWSLSGFSRATNYFWVTSWQVTIIKGDLILLNGLKLLKRQIQHAIRVALAILHATLAVVSSVWPRTGTSMLLLVALLIRFSFVHNTPLF